MVGICSDTRKGAPLLGEGEGTVSFDSHIPLIGLAHLHPLALLQGEATKHARVRAIPILCGGTKAQYPVVHPVRTPSNCVIFRL